MKISANLENSLHNHRVTVKTNDVIQQVSLPGKTTGFGSSINGGELLLLSLATCFCNDIYREANKKGIHISKVSVEVSAEFAAEGAPGYNFVIAQTSLVIRLIRNWQH